MAKEVRGNKVSRHLSKINARETDEVLKKIMKIEGLVFTERDLSEMKLVDDEQSTKIFLDTELESLDLNVAGRLMQHFHEQLRIKPTEVSEWSDKFRVLYEIPFENASIVLHVRKPFLG